MRVVQRHMRDELRMGGSVVECEYSGMCGGMQDKAE
jgi:hypothetical protein